MTRQEFGKFIAVVRGIYRDESFLKVEESAEAWYELLKDLAYEQIKAAVAKHAMTSKWCPSIAEIREQVVEIQSDSGDWSDGWKEVLTAVRRYGYTDEAGALASMSPMTKEAVMRLGWKQICLSEQDDLMALRANFRMIYQEKTKTIKEEMQLPQDFKDRIKMLTERNELYLNE